MTIKYQIFIEEELIVVRYIGDFSVAEYMTFVKEIIDTNEWKAVSKGLTDLREANLKVAYKNMSQIVKFRKIFENKTFSHVYLVDNPTSTAITNMYINTIKTNYRYCSTLKFAVKLLGLKKTETEVEKILSNMKYQR